jgi:glutathione S-transferase
VWDTLAIAEYLAETFPEFEMWPSGKRARAMARAVTAEMHSGFPALRSEMEMLFAEEGKHVTPSDACNQNIIRIQSIWEEARETHGQGGRFLFGNFSIADAFFAPVVSRFRTYGVKCEGAAADYAAMMWELPSMQQWFKGAQAELLEAEK